MRLRVGVMGVFAVVAVSCGAAGDESPQGDEYEILNAYLRDEHVVSVQVGSCNAEHREAVIDEGAEAVEVSVFVEGDTPSDCLDGGLDVELAAPLGERELLDGATGQVLEVYSEEYPEPEGEPLGDLSRDNPLDG